MKMHRLSLLAWCALALCGCAIGNKYDYDDAKAQVAYRGHGRVAVAAWDRRPYVLSGDKDPDFVGLQRNNMGIPFKVVTASRQPLATEMGHALVLSLADAGFGAMPVEVTPQDSEGNAVYSLLRNKPGRAVLLRVDDWESDNYHNPTVVYDLTLNVYDGSGRKLASKSLKGSDDLHGSAFNPMGKAKEIVPAEFQQKMQLLLNTPEVQTALR